MLSGVTGLQYKIAGLQFKIGKFVASEPQPGIMGPSGHRRAGGLVKVRSGLRVLWFSSQGSLKEKTILRGARKNRILEAHLDDLLSSPGGFGQALKDWAHWNVGLGLCYLW